MSSKLNKSMDVEQPEQYVVEEALESVLDHDDPLEWLLAEEKINAMLADEAFELLLPTR